MKAQALENKADAIGGVKWVPGNLKSLEGDLREYTCILMLNVRLTLKTDDGHLIYMRYEGMRHGPQWVIEALNKGEKVDPNQYYFRTTPWFETASEKYRFLNRIVCVATGRRDPSGPVYEVFHIL